MHTHWYAQVGGSGANQPQPVPAHVTFARARRLKVHSRRSQAGHKVLDWRALCPSQN